MQLKQRRESVSHDLEEASDKTEEAASDVSDEMEADVEVDSSPAHEDKVCEEAETAVDDGDVSSVRQLPRDLAKSVSDYMEVRTIFSMLKLVRVYSFHRIETRAS